MLSKIFFNIFHCGLDILRQSKRPSFKSILNSYLVNLIPKTNRRRYDGTILKIKIYSNFFSNYIFFPVEYNQSIINIKEDISPNGSTIIHMRFSRPDIRTSLVWSKTNMHHTWSKVLPKISTAWFTSIQSTMNEGNFANILKAKFGTTNYIVCFWWLIMKISILNTRWRNIQTIQCSIG